MHKAFQYNLLQRFKAIISRSRYEHNDSHKNTAIRYTDVVLIQKIAFFFLHTHALGFQFETSNHLLKKICNKTWRKKSSVVFWNLLKLRLLIYHHNKYIYMWVVSWASNSLHGLQREKKDDPEDSPEVSSVLIRLLSVAIPVLCDHAVSNTHTALPRCQLTLHFAAVETTTESSSPRGWWLHRPPPREKEIPFLSGGQNGRVGLP